MYWDSSYSETQRSGHPPVARSVNKQTDGPARPGGIDDSVRISVLAAGIRIVGDEPLQRVLLGGRIANKIVVIVHHDLLVDGRKIFRLDSVDVAFRYPVFPVVSLVES